MNLSSLTHSELQKLKTQVENEIERRRTRQRGRAMTEIKSIVAKYGLKLEDLVGDKRPIKTKLRKGASVRSTKKSLSTSKNAGKSTKKVRAVLYRHPEDAKLTWSGGRGRLPQWVKDWKDSGRSLDEVRVAPA